MKRWLPEKLERLLGRKRGEDDLLKPREVRFGTELRFLTMVAPSILIFTAMRPLLDGRSLQEPRVLAAFVSFMALAFGLIAFGVFREARVKSAQVGDPKEVVDLELSHVKWEVELASVDFAIRVVHQAGPDAPLLPDVKRGVMTISKRFWTEFSPDEQLAALRYVRYGGTDDVRSHKAHYRLLYFLLAAIAVAILYESVGLGGAIVVGLIALALGIFGANRFIDVLAVRRWNKIAHQLNLPKAPILILRKLLEEVEDPAERRHLEWVLKAYVSDFPPGSRIREEFGAPAPPAALEDEVEEVRG